MLYAFFSLVIMCVYKIKHKILQGVHVVFKHCGNPRPVSAYVVDHQLDVTCNPSETSHTTTI